MQERAKAPVNLRLTGVEVDLQRGEVRSVQGAVPLTTREVDLLAYLAAQAGQTVSRDELHERVWLLSPKVRSRAVDFTVHRLRSKIERDPSQPRHLLKVHGVGYRLVLLEDAESALPDRASVLAGRVDRRAASWHGDPVSTATAMRALRERAEEVAREHGGTLSRAVPPLLAFAEAAAALAAARRLIEAHPTLAVAIATGPVELWVRGTAVEVDGPAAVCAEALAGAWEAGTVVVDAATADALPGVALRDLGARHLPDLPQPICAFTLGFSSGGPTLGFSSGGPTLGFSSGGPTPREVRTSGLELAADRLVGRDRELEQVRSLLAAQPVVTLWGPGGVGKTRLAREVAQGWLARGAQAWMCEVRAARSPEQLRLAVGAAVGASPAPGRLEAALGARGEWLLVLDCADALPEAVAELAGQLTRTRGPLHARILVTSRVRPRDGAVVEIGPLDPDGAFAVLVDRAERVHPGYGADPAPIRAIAEAIGGLPLALELVGARAALMGPRQLLRAVQEGGLTSALAPTVAWSLDLLEPSLAALLERLSVFPSSFALDDAVALMDGVSGVDVADGLAVLRDRALLRDAGDDVEPRLALYDVVRDVARGRIRASGGWPEAVARHAEVLLGRGEQLVEARGTFREPAALGRLARDLPDLLAIEARAREAGDLATRARAVAVAGPPMLWRGPQGLVEQLLDPLLPEAERIEPHVALRLLRMASGLAKIQGDRPRSRRLHEQRIALARRIGDEAEVIFAQARLARLDPRPEELRQREAWVEALAERGRPDLAAQLCNDLILDFGREDPAREEGWFQRGVELARQAGYRAMESYLLMSHGSKIAEDPGRAREGALLVFRASRLQREVGDEWGAVGALGNAAYALVLGGEVLEGRDLLVQAREQALQIGNLPQHALTAGQLGDVALAEGDVDGAGRWLETSATEGRGLWGGWQEAQLSAMRAGLRWATEGGGASLEDLDRALVRLGRQGDVAGWRAVHACLLAADGRADEAARTLPEGGEGQDREVVEVCRAALPLLSANRWDDAIVTLKDGPRSWHTIRLVAWLARRRPGGASSPRQ